MQLRVEIGVLIARAVTAAALYAVIVVIVISHGGYLAYKLSVSVHHALYFGLYVIVLIYFLTAVFSVVGCLEVECRAVTVGVKPICSVIETLHVSYAVAHRITESVASREHRWHKPRLIGVLGKHLKFKPHIYVFFVIRYAYLSQGVEVRTFFCFFAVPSIKLVHARLVNLEKPSVFRRLGSNLPISAAHYLRNVYLSELDGIRCARIGHFVAFFLSASYPRLYNIICRYGVAFLVTFHRIELVIGELVQVHNREIGIGIGEKQFCVIVIPRAEAKFN